MHRTQTHLDASAKSKMDAASKAVDSNYSALHHAIQDNKFTSTLALIMKGNDLNTLSKLQRTALHFAAMTISKSVRILLKESAHFIEIYRLLIHEGINFYLLISY